MNEDLEAPVLEQYADYPRADLDVAITWPMRLARGLITANLWSALFLIAIVATAVLAFARVLTLTRFRGLDAMLWIALASYAFGFLYGLISSKKSTAIVPLVGVASIPAGVTWSSFLRIIIFRFHGGETALYWVTAAYVVLSLWAAWKLNLGLRPRRIQGS